MTRFIAREGTYFLRADTVQLGDLLDLQGDQYADPDRFADPDAEPVDNHRLAMEYELAVVEAVVIEPHDVDPVAVIYTSLGTYGFPVDHEIEASLDRNAPTLLVHGDDGLWRHPGDPTSETFTDAQVAARYGNRGAGWEESDDKGRTFIAADGERYGWGG